MAKGLDPNQALLRMAEMIKEGSRAPNIGKYKPHEKQYQFHCSYCKKKLYIGGNRSGKTTGGVVEAIWRASCTHPYRPELNAIGPNRGRVVAVDFLKGVDQILLPQYKQWVKPSMLRGGSWNTAWEAQARILTFANGSTIEFMSYEQGLDKFAGTSRHWIHFDEEPPKSIFTECLARLVDTNGEYWITMTPVEGITWIHDELYEPNIDLPANERTVEIVEINTLENPYLTQEGVQNLMDSMDTDDTVTRIGGGFVRKGGRVYKNFDPTLGAVQVLAESIRDPKTYFPAERGWMWGLSLDHGFNNPTAVGWYAINTEGFLVKFDEWYKNDLTVQQHAQVIHQKIKEHGRFPDLLIADPALKQKNGVSGTSIWEEYIKYGLPFTMGNNDVKAGIIRVKKYFTPADYPGPNGAARHPLYGGSQSLPNATDDVVAPCVGGKYARLLIDPKCVNTVKEHKSYRWKTYTDKKKQYENNPYDEPHKKDDHTCDETRYLIMSQPDISAPLGETQAAKLQHAVDHFKVDIMQPAKQFADPNNRIPSIGQPGMWDPSVPLPKETNWELDEHLGGLL